MRYNIKTVESAKTHVVRGNQTSFMMSSESRKFCLHGMYVKLEQCFVWLCLLCCGDQHKQTDEAVLQGAEVLRREHRL